MSGPRAFHAATILQNGKVLVSGGSNASGDIFTSAELYDPTTGVWTPTDSMAAARRGHDLVLLGNGGVLAVGGSTISGGEVGSIELFTPGTGNWTPAGNMLLPRAENSTTLLNDGTVLIVGGVFHDATPPPCSAFHKYCRDFPPRNRNLDPDR